MKKLTWVFEGLDRVLSTISAITLFIMMMWIFTDVLLRSLFNNPLQGTVEITGEYLMVILVYLMISNTHKFQGHVTVDVFQKKMPDKIKNITKFITNLIAAIFFGTICVLNFQEGLDYFQQNINSIGILNYPLAPALFIISLGLGMITLRLLIECVVLVFPIQSKMNPKSDEVNKEIKAESKIDLPA